MAAIVSGPHPSLTPHVFPDNEAVSYRFDNQTLLLDCLPETKKNHYTGLQKQLAIELSSEGSRVRLCHRLENQGLWPIETAGGALA